MWPGTRSARLSPHPSGAWGLPVAPFKDRDPARGPYPQRVTAAQRITQQRSATQHLAHEATQGRNVLPLLLFQEASGSLPNPSGLRAEEQGWNEGISQPPALSEVRMRVLGQVTSAPPPPVNERGPAVPRSPAPPHGVWLPPRRPPSVRTPRASVGAVGCALRTSTSSCRQRVTAYSPIANRGSTYWLLNGVSGIGLPRASGL